MEFVYTLIDMLNEMSPYILLGFFIAGLLHAFVPTSMMSRHLSGNGIVSVIKGAAIGIPLPLCSCGVLPTAVALHKGGASKAASSSFLIATPQTGVDSIAATYSLLGPAFAVIRPVAALITSVAGGLFVGRATENESETKSISHSSSACGCEDDVSNKTFIDKIKETFVFGFHTMVQSIGKWLIIGLVIATLITIFVPENFLVALGDRPLLAMLAVVVIAIPMYVCATGSIPIALSLMLKGLSPGAGFVLLMAGPAANFASMTIISRTMGRKAAAAYLGSIIVGAVFFGLLIDYILPHSWFISPLSAVTGSCHHELPLF
ncbi:MAG: SO_0444 family Cu/Zn efflux transporter, partial [Duncaniella sp.]|nr:SO_0444 family Cu/Zn efflux transporter [Duncaniella sp.]